MILLSKIDIWKSAAILSANGNFAATGSMAFS